MTVLEIGIEAIERGLVPDALTRQAIRRLCSERLQASRDRARGQPTSSRGILLESMRSGPIALVPEKANQQHYEFPPEFFTAVLGPRRKYSCCYFSSGSSTLAEAEEEALAITCQRAGLANGQEILELGCGWGSLSLWMAERFPGSQITAVSNSAPQRQFIEAEALSRRLRQFAGHHRRHQRLFAGWGEIRPRGFRGNVRTPAKLRTPLVTDCFLVAGGRQTVRPYLLPPRSVLSLRSR